MPKKHFSTRTIILTSSLSLFAMVIITPALGDMQPIFFDHYYFGSPVFCIFGQNDRFQKEAVNAVHDWQYQLRNYTNNFKSWKATILENPTVVSSCTTEIHILAKPSDQTLDAVGIQYDIQAKGMIQVYTEQYYFTENHKVVMDKSNKPRPMPFDFADVSISAFGKAVRHELGHDFGLVHQGANSIMVTGYDNPQAKISVLDLQQVVKHFGNDWSNHQPNSEPDGTQVYSFYWSKK